MVEFILQKIKDFKWLIGLVGALGLVLAVSFLFVTSNQSTEEEVSIDNLATSVLSKSSSSDKGEASPVGTETESTTIMVDVKGAVERPGLYKLSRDSRVDDAIKAAGGMTDQAEPKSVNLAQKLADEDIVYVATNSEDLSVIPEASASSDSAKADETETKKVNINRATAEELMTISGIGEKRAQDIIAYREENGAFTSVDDLKNVSGIGDKTLENMRAYVTVD